MGSGTGSGTQAALVAALRDPQLYGIGTPVEQLETHISYVLLAGDTVYKIKKAVDLGFLNFSTLAAREFFCREELRLNRRTAPDLYLDVVAITGTPEHPVPGGRGPAIEWAVRMRRFAQRDRLDHCLEDGRLHPEHIDALARRIAELHAAAAVAGAETVFGTPAAVWQPVAENFTQIAATPINAAARGELEVLRSWSEARFTALRDTFSARRAGGRVRECHGDLHLGNAALVDGEVTLFDCIEFNDNLRWIDVLSDAAFAVMDLEARGRADFARRCLNRYLEYSGDYAGLAVLDFYRVYRALVRAKIACLRGVQADLPAQEQAPLLAEFRRYLALARGATRPGTPALIITHGVSGSGKTTLTQPLLERIGAVRIRSDVERKRLQGLPALAQTDAGVAGGIYRPEITARTYAHLADQAAAVIGAGYPALVDATFLRRAQRDLLRERAARLGVPFLILNFSAAAATLRARIEQRRQRGRDASEATVAVLERQLATQEALAADELTAALCFTAPPQEQDWLAVEARLGRSRGAGEGVSV